MKKVKMKKKFKMMKKVKTMEKFTMIKKVKGKLQLRYSPKRKARLIKFCWPMNILLQVLMPTMTADMNSWSPKTC